VRIAIVGAGGIGAPLGASLAAAGQDVAFLARGAHLTAMQANGLRVEGDRGESVIRPVQATDDPASLGHVDLVLFCVKLWDVETAGNHIRPLIGGETVVIPLQNGIDASERLAPIFGAAHVQGGVALVSGSIVAPGVVRQTGTHRGIVFGEFDGQATARATRVHAVCTAAARQRAQAADGDQSDKFLPASALDVVGQHRVDRRPIGDVRDDPDLGPLLDVGRACGVQFPREILPSVRATMMRPVPPYGMPSMAVDLRAGNRLELPWLAGKVVQLGAEHGVPTPINRVVYAALKPYMNGPPA
jgi:2-dehydropantoate 2-reductase